MDSARFFSPPCSPSPYRTPPLTLPVIALVSLLTLLPANLIVRQRPGWRGRPRPEMDWAAFRDVPYMLMMAGMFFSFWGVFFGFYYVRLASLLIQEPPLSFPTSGYSD